jgi:hypothetical protein
MNVRRFGVLAQPSYKACRLSEQPPIFSAPKSSEAVNQNLMKASYHAKREEHRMWWIHGLYLLVGGWVCPSADRHMHGARSRMCRTNAWVVKVK